MKTIMVNNVKTKVMTLLLLVVTLFSVVAPMTMQDCMFTPKFASAATDVLGDISFDPNGSGVDVKVTTSQTSSGDVITKYRAIITIVFAILTITMAVFLAINIAKLGAAGDNQVARSKAIGGILTTGIATALLGSFSVWFGFFYHAIKTT